MNKNLFSKFFLISFVSFSIFIIIETQNYKYIFSKTFITLFVLNIIVLITFFFKNKRFLIYVNLFVLFISIFIINLIFFITDPSITSPKKKLEFITKNNFYPDVPPITHLKDNNKILPLSGLSNVKTVTANENGYWGVYEADEHGFNNKLGQHLKILNTDKSKLIFLGDSMTLGSAVYQNENFVSRINESKDFTSLNLAYGGNGLLLSLAAYIEYGKHIKNANVIFCFYEGNDFYEYEVEEKQNKKLKKYLNENYTQNLLNLNKAKNTLVKNKILKHKNSIQKEGVAFKIKFYYNEIIKIYQFRKKIGLLNNKKEMLAYSDENFKDFEKILDLYENLVKKNNSKFTFLYIPSREHFYPGHPYTNAYDRIIKILNKKNIKYIDMYSKMKETGKPLDFFSRKIMRHFNAEGHKKASEIILNNLY